MCKECEPIEKEEPKIEEAVCGCGCLGFKGQEQKQKMSDKTASGDNLSLQIQKVIFLF